MTQPAATGSNPAAWGLPGPVLADVQVPVHGAPARDLLYVRSPVTGDVRGVTQAEAQELVFRAGWEPVVEPDAVRLLETQIMRERASPYQALLYGAARGVSGGLAEFVLPQGEDPGARALDAIREEYPGTALAGEVGGALLPLSRAFGAVRYASPVALAEAAGQGATRAAAGAAPGVGRSILARAGGTAVEGGLVGSTYEAGQSRIEDSPLTAQKIAGGFLAGALPGALIGAPLGAAEGLGARFGRRAAKLQAEALAPGISDADLMKIAHREHGVAVPGMIEHLQAAIQRDPNVAPDFLQLAKDSGLVGRQVRGELLDAPNLRAAAERRAADGLNAVQELDELAIQGWIHGKPKRALIQQWLDAGPAEIDIDAAIAQARNADPTDAAIPQGGATVPEQAPRNTFAALDNMQDGGGRFMDLRKLIGGMAREQQDEFLLGLRDRGLVDLKYEDPKMHQGRLRGQIDASELVFEGRRYNAATLTDEGAAEWQRLREAGTPAAPELPAVPTRAQAVNDLAEAVKRSMEVDPRLRDALASQLGARNDPEIIAEVIAAGLAKQDDNVSSILSEALKSASPRSKEVFSINAHKMLAKNPELLQWRARSARLIDGLGQEADDMLALTPGVRGQPASEARKVRDLFANARARIASGDRAEGFAALDELKGRLGPHAKPDAWLGGDDNVARFVRRGYEEIRQTLEDASLWGERAASAQRDMNALFHRRLARAEGYHRQFFDDAGRPHPRNPWVNAKVATPEKVRKALAGIVNPDDSEALALFRGHVAETRELADRVREYYNLTPDADAAVGNLLKGVDNAEAGLNEAVTFARREAQASELFNNRANIVPGYAKWVALGFLGPAGFAAVKVAENIANPGQRIFQRAVLERVLRGSESRLAKAVLGLTTGKKVRFPGVGATQLAGRASASLFHEEDPKKRAESYASSLAELTRLTSPEAAAAAAKNAIPFAVNTLPMAPQHLGFMLSRAAQYVLAKAPVKPQLTARGVEVIVPSDSELDEWERIWSGAFDPISAFEDAAKGEGSLAAMQAAEFVAPDLVQEGRMLVIENLQGKEVSHNRVVDISIVLGVPLDSTLEPDYINAQQMIHAARFKDSEAQKSRRSFQETGVNREYKQSGADRVEADIPPE